jgi:hypothetical protein
MNDGYAVGLGIVHIMHASEVIWEIWTGFGYESWMKDVSVLDETGTSAFVSSFSPGFDRKRRGWEPREG